ncbi:hypothetical protein EVA_18748 [gut metagenome]|uniref:Uncharacterized protein n=1 Tax=gut metagenome TaxID=749906 RepID=J9C022_9ZZZZ
MDIAGDDDMLGFGVGVCKYVVIVHLLSFFDAKQLLTHTK